ncbi:ABC transporter ATP-binding protein [Bordetella sputigena]|uniref:ABC transporter ATP-binding protein n=1 Tax=Bordetella sputigena TaxID=1416810 RepID=UPI0039F0C87A
MPISEDKTARADSADYRGSPRSIGSADTNASAAPLLTVRGLAAGYGKIGILHGIDLDVGAGEIVAILGPNGAGKSTLMRAISGLLPLGAGSISFGGVDLSRATPRDAARAGLVHVIEGHRVFTQQSVIDNLMLAGYDAPRAERRTRVDEALAYFPEIAAKRHDRAGALSGGQQQMLVVAQGLVKRPRLLILDEPSAGLSPVLVDRVLTVAGQLRKQGTAIVLVEQLVEKALALADRVYALAQGRIAMQAGTREADLAARLERAYFGDHGRVAAQ